MLITSCSLPWPSHESEKLGSVQLFLRLKKLVQHKVKLSIFSEGNYFKHRPLHCTDNSKQIFPEMKLCGRVVA
jgi:hypothetical protein